MMPRVTREPVTSRERSRKSQRASDIAFYNIEITDWDWEYSFSVNSQKHEDRSFADCRHLHIRGKVWRPRKIRTDAVEIIFIPKSGFAEMERHHNKPAVRGVGTVSVEGTKAEGTKLAGYLSMPTDALGLVLQMLLAGRFKYLLLDGEPMRYRKAFIRHYRFTGQYKDEDYPDD
jgi:hypothetical protein